jgi:hypothetical protein
MSEGASPRVLEEEDYEARHPSQLSSPSSRRGGGWHHCGGSVPSRPWRLLLAAAAAVMLLASGSNVLREQRLAAGTVTSSSALLPHQQAPPPSPPLPLLSSLWRFVAGATPTPTSSPSPRATPSPSPHATTSPSTTAWPSRTPTHSLPPSRVGPTRRSTRTGTGTGSATGSVGATPPALRASPSAPPLTPSPSGTPSVPASPAGTPAGTPTGSHTPSNPPTPSVTPSALATHATLVGMDPFRDWADVAAPEWRAQPPLDAWTLRRHARVPTPESVGFPPGDATPTAYILTGNVTGARYRHTAVRAAAVGFRPVPHVGGWPRGDTLRHPSRQRFCATRYAHTDAWQRFVDDPSTGEGDYAFFFEDDVGVTPPATPRAVHVGWRHALQLEAVSRRGVLYLGACGALSTDLSGTDWLRNAIPPVPPGDGIDDGLYGAPRGVVDDLVRGWVAQQTARDELRWQNVLADHGLTARPLSSPEPTPPALADDASSGDGSGGGSSSAEAYMDSRRRRLDGDVFYNESFAELTTGPFWLPDTFVHRMVRAPPTALDLEQEQAAAAAAAANAILDPTPGPSRTPRPLEREVLQLGLVTFPRCAACMHAYGLRKDAARHLARRMQQLTPRMDDACDFRRAIRRGVDPRDPGEVVNADTALLEVCLQDWKGMPLLGSNLPAPGEESHTGVFYQDRVSFGSSLVPDNYGVLSKPTVRREPWETDEDFARRRRRRRRLGAQQQRKQQRR